MNKIHLNGKLIQALHKPDFNDKILVTYFDQVQEMSAVTKLAIVKLCCNDVYSALRALSDLGDTTQFLEKIIPTCVEVLSQDELVILS